MNSVSIFSNCLRNASSPGLNVPANISLQQIRNTFILRRRHPPNIIKKGTTHKRFKQRNFIYDFVEDTDVKPRPPLKLILTQFVDGIGDRGEIITQPPMTAYNNFLLPGLAVYATPENVVKYDAKNVDDYKVGTKSRFIDRTLNILSQYLLNVVMSAENPWTLEKWHMRSAFRKSGIFLNEDCITMPEKPIAGPNLNFENKEFYVTVTVNKTSDVRVRCRIHHWSNDLTQAIPFVPQFYLKPSEPIYPEDKPVLEAMPLPYLMQQAINKENATLQ